MKPLNKIFITCFILLLTNISFANDTAMVKTNQTNIQASNSSITKRDGEIISFIEAIDEHEINAADIAIQHSVKGDLLNYVNELKSDHTNNLSAAQTLSQTIPTNEDKTVINFKMKGKKDLESLSKQTGNNFDKDFIMAMIKGHEKGLEMVNKFAKETKNVALKQFIETTKQMITKHLQQAKMLKKMMK